MISQNDTLITDNLQLANLFNKYFSQTSSELRQQILINSKDQLTFFDEAGENDSAFISYESTTDEVATLFSKLPNKSTLLNKIPTILYKKMSHMLTSVLSELYLTSFVEGIFPSCLKVDVSYQFSNQVKNIRRRATGQSLLYLSYQFFWEINPQENDLFP